MEMSEEEQEALFLLVAVVIHLGNIEFESGDGGRARITNPALVSTIAKVCSYVPVENQLLNKKIDISDPVFIFLWNSYLDALKINW